MAHERVGSMIKDVLAHKKAAAAGTLSALAFAGCGGHDVAGSTQAIEPCGERIYDYQFGKTPLSPEAVKKVVATSQADVVELQKRALANRSSINLDDYDTVEVTASRNELTIGFAALTWTDDVGDYVSFEAKDGSATVDAGAVICSANGNLYQNGTYQGLQKYTRETATFPG